MVGAGSKRFRRGAGRLCLDFVRTLRYRGSPAAEEELPDPDALGAWVHQFGPELADHREPATPSETATASARQLREAIYRLLVAARSSTGVASCPTADRRLINAAADRAVPAPRLDPDGRLRWHADDPAAAALALVARDALELVTSDAIGKVRNCANPACQVMFLDSSRPGTRRWCSMGSCGNLAKKATLRAKS